MDRFNRIKQEMKKDLENFLLFNAIIFIILYVIFFSSELGRILYLYLGILWLIILPSWFISMALFKGQDIQFISKILIAIVLMIGISGVIPYYLGIMGLDVNILHIGLPIGVIIISLLPE